jgi:hypothetical protein
MNKINFRVFAQNFIRRFNSERKFGRFWSEFWLNHISPNAIFRLWFILPLNGQARRLFNIHAISYLMKPTVVIETGTYFASSTYLFLGIPTVKQVYSIESNPGFFQIAKERYPKELLNNKLNFVLGDSKIEFEKIVNTLHKDSDTLLCYLDAHWEGDIPTVSEIQALVNWGGNWVAVIDDFLVPGLYGEGYGYDRYGDVSVDKNLFIQYPNVILMVPFESSIVETGARRGTGYAIGGKKREENLGALCEELKLERIN